MTNCAVGITGFAREGERERREKRSLWRTRTAASAWKRVNVYVKVSSCVCERVAGSRKALF